MSRASLNTSIDTTITTNSSNGITGAAMNTQLKELVTEARLAEDLIKDNQNGSILLDNEGRGRWYGTDTVKTGNITVDLTGAVTGGTGWVIHNDATEPTITGATKKNFSYNTGQVNYIKITYVKLSAAVIASTPFAAESKSISSGTGAPESVVTGNIGDIYLRTDGEQDTIVYRKVSGTGNTGWLSDQDAQSFITLTDAATITWDVRNAAGTGRKNAIVTLTANRTLANPAGVKDGDRLRLIVFQDATGNRSLTLSSKFSLINKTEQYTVASSFDIIEIVYNLSKDKFYYSYQRVPPKYNQYLMLGASVDISLDMGTDSMSWLGRTIEMNNANSTGSNLDTKLPPLADLPLGFWSDFVLTQGANGADIIVKAANATDLFMINPGLEMWPYGVETVSGIRQIQIKDAVRKKSIYIRMVVREVTSGGGTKMWDISNFSESSNGWSVITGITSSFTPDKKTHGNKMSISLAGITTIQNPIGYADGDEITIRLVQDSTGYLVGIGGQWKRNSTADWFDSDANSIQILKASYFESGSEWLIHFCNQDMT